MRCRGSSARATTKLGATRLRASVGRGIKEPLFIQSYSPSPSFLGNPNLEPERSRGFDVGIEQRFAGDRVAIEADLLRQPLRRSHQPRAVRSRSRSTRSTRTSAKRARRASSSWAPRSSMAGFGVSGGYTCLDSKVIRSISSSPIFAPGQHALPAAAPFGIAAGVVLAQSREPGARRRVRRIARRHRLQLPHDHVERGLRRVECERRGSHRAPHGRLRHDRQPGRPRLHGAARLSRRLAARCAWAFGRGSDGAPEGRHFLERRKGLVRGIPPRTRHLRLRRRHHHVQRGRHAQPIARPAAGDSRGAGRAARPAVDHADVHVGHLRRRVRSRAGRLRRRWASPTSSSATSCSTSIANGPSG